MLKNNFETRVKIQQIVESQLPGFILDESPKTVDFLKQYYISQEYQGGSTDLSDNIDQYIKLDTLIPLSNRFTTLVGDIGTDSETISVTSTDGYPESWGILKIGDEIITYKSKTATTFDECIRGFSSITDYSGGLDSEELIFKTSNAESHSNGVSVENIGIKFLEEFYRKIKFTIAPGLQEYEFHSNVDISNFLKEVKSLYQTKGTSESFRILYKVLYNESPQIVNLEDLLLKSSSAKYRRKEIVFAEAIDGVNLLPLKGRTIFKNTDLSTSAAISSIESFTRNGKIYYEMSFFIGYSEFSAIEGTFTITPSTKLLADASLSTTNSVISVDSTIGFAQSGDLISGNTTITYEDKTVNQFLNCKISSGTQNLERGSIIRNDEVYFGTASGSEEKLYFRIIGTLDNSINTENINSIDEDEEIRVKNLGKYVEDNDENATQVFANSWIYNTCASYDVNIDSGSVLLVSPANFSSLKVGDNIELVDRNSGEVYQSNGEVYVSSISSNGQVSTNGGSFSGADENKSYKIRRKLNTARSTNNLISNGNDVISSDIQNVYFDDKSYAYVTSNGLPSSTIDIPGLEDVKYRIDIDDNICSVSIASAIFLDDENQDGTFNKILVPTDQVDNFTSLIEGDEIFYESQYQSFVGLQTGNYYIGNIVKTNNNIEFKLFSSRAFVGSVDNLKIQIPPVGIGATNKQTFTLSAHKSKKIKPSKLAKKFPLDTNIKNIPEVTKPGTTGLLVNGVEIYNYKSTDKIYYGKLKSIDVVSPGRNFDVINPPLIEIGESPTNTGTNATVQPVISGVLTDVLVDTQDYDIGKILSVDITGGNGEGAIIEPIVTKRHRIVSFDGRSYSSGGGIVLNTNTNIPLSNRNRIEFLTDHNFSTGDEIIYSSSGYTNIVTSNGDLQDGASYYVRFINTSTIQIYNSKSDAISDTNKIVFTTASSGAHSFRTAEFRNTISDVIVISGGSGYTNRKLRVQATAILTAQDSVFFKDHGFSSGDRVFYEVVGSSIGLSTTNQYIIKKIDNDTFKLCDAGANGQNTTNFDNNNFAQITSAQEAIFKYPDINVSIEYQPVSTESGQISSQTLQITPVVKGSIIDTYLIEEGSGYGSTILNYRDIPTVKIKNGINAGIKASIVNGKIVSAFVQYGGTEYYSVPDLIITDNSTNPGTGAKLRAIVQNGIITDVKVVNQGLGYSNDVTVTVKSSGENASIVPQLNEWTINNVERFVDDNNVKKYDNFFDDGELLKYVIGGYKAEVRNYLNQIPNTLGNIIGWAYDGNPIYGPYGNPNPESTSGSVPTRLKSSYNLNVITDTDLRPGGFGNGYFVEDYVFDKTNNDLDEYNGRYEKNSDFPNGVYAYHATIDSVGNPQFPYFIGNSYKSQTLTENESLNQDNIDYDTDNLRRNSFPYNILANDKGYDFIEELENIENQKVIVKSVTSGNVSGLEIVDSGKDYNVNDKIIFDNNNNSGGGVDAVISSIQGKTIQQIDTSLEKYENCEIVWKNKSQLEVFTKPSGELEFNDYINISNVSKSSALPLVGSYKIIVNENNALSVSTITSGVGNTSILVSNIPERLSVGSTVTIGSENLQILEISRNNSILKLKRGNTGTSHAIYSKVNYKPDSFIIETEEDYFESDENVKVYFNASESVGFGTTVGVATTVSVNTAYKDPVIRSLPTQSIFIENHPFVNNQKLLYTKDASTNDLSVSTDGQTTQNLSPGSFVYVSNKGKDFIGIKGSVNSDLEYFFHGTGQDNDFHSFTTQKPSVTGTITKLNTTVTTETSHGLQEDDLIHLNVVPKLNVGIGTSTAVRFFGRGSAASANKVVINPIEFANTDVTLSSADLGSYITIENHGLKTGDKILWVGNQVDTTSGTNPDEFYVFKIDDDKIKVSRDYTSAIQDDPVTLDFAGTGLSNQTISSINPGIRVVKNNNLVIYSEDLDVNGNPTNPLSNHGIKFYYDSNLKDEFVSTGKITTFPIVSGTSTGSAPDVITGIAGTSRTVTLTYDESFPNVLYYTFVKDDGTQILPDRDVIGGSKIEFVNSLYNTDYRVVSKTDSAFNIVLTTEPEKLNYTSVECKTLDYSTSSKTATGPIKTTRILSSGYGYKKLPKFDTISSTNGSGAYLTPKTETIGKIKNVEVKNKKFQYAYDKTLSPVANISPNILVKNANILTEVSVENTGSNYTVAPDLRIIDAEDSSTINSGSLVANLKSGTISSVDIESTPSGIPEKLVKIVAVNNDNGINILRMESNNSGIFTCLLPLPGLNQPQWFTAGDEVYIEGIVKDGTDGSGFNSEDYEYSFFTINAYSIGTNPNYHEVEFNISTLTTNTGLAKTVQDGTASMILKANYPVFDTKSKRTEFLRGESLTVNGNSTDLKLISFDGSILKVQGSYELKFNDVVIGRDSSSIVTVKSVEDKSGSFNISYSVLDEGGWDTSIGKLNVDYQVTPDNDYYQNMSYSIKSKQTFEKSQPLVKSNLHISGLKDFYDTQLESTTDDSQLEITGEDVTSVTMDVIEEERVDIHYDFDNGFDSDTTSTQTSRFIKFENKKLTDYIKGGNNVVLGIDDFSDDFANEDLSTSSFSDIVDLQTDPIGQYTNLLIRIENDDTSQMELAELVVLKDDSNNIFLSEKILLINEDDDGAGDLYFDDTKKYGDFVIREDVDENKFIVFQPTDNNKFTQNYKIKVLRNTLLGTANGSLDLGHSKSSGTTLTSSAAGESSIVSIACTSMFVNAHILDTTTNDMNFVEMYVSRIDDDLYIADYYHDSDSLRGLSGQSVGILTATTSGDNIDLRFINESGNTIKVSTKTVAFSDTQFSATTEHRFKTERQSAGKERSAIIDSTFIPGAALGTHTLINIDENLFNAVKCIVEVHDTTANKKELHQLVFIHDGTNLLNSWLQQSQILAVSSDFNSDSNNEYSDVNLGSFAAVRSTGFKLQFTPTSTSNVFEFNVLSYKFYSGIDELNVAPDLTYGRVVEKLYNRNFSYESKLQFELLSNGTPIFMKTFDPDSNAGVLNTATGNFNIRNHFFNTGQELNYRAESTIVDQPETKMRDGNSAFLPDTVYAVRIDDDNFKIALTRTDALAANPTTITISNVGDGNAHKFEMVDRDSKCLISVDGLIQQPLIYTGVSHNLSNSITNNADTFELAGISSIRTSDILKIENEYVIVNNVGFGEANNGPITGIGNIPLVTVTRGAMGSQSAAHNTPTAAEIYRGSFNITNNQINFAEPPRGTFEGGDNRDDGNLMLPKSQFNGRVYLRSEDDGAYRNRIYDDISNEFTGIGKTFTLTVGGANVSGIGTVGGSGIVMVNGMFQQPTTDNNPNGNFQIEEDTTAGITTIVFSEIKTPDTNQFVEADYDINKKELPRGGAIVSLGSTPGLGFAPLKGAKALVETSSGQITNIYTAPRSGSAIGIDNVSYNNLTGELTITTSTNHNFTTGDPDVFAYISGLAFTCDYSPTTTYFPENTPNLNLSNAQNNNNEFPIVSVQSDTQFTVNVGVSTIEHTYVGNNPSTPNSSQNSNLAPWYQTLNAGSGYYGNVSVALTDVGSGTGAVISAVPDTSNGGSLTITDSGTQSGYPDGLGVVKLEIPAPSYDNLPIVGTFRVGEGATTETGIGFSMNVRVGAAATTDSNPNPNYEVKEFQITKPGYAFRKGDKFKPVGLVTATGLANPIQEFELTVIETYTDSFAAWEFGELDFIDSLKPYQDGTRVRFPLLYNGELISFETADDSRIDYNYILLVFMNGVVQVPGESYTFNGGTSFLFTEPPKVEDNISVYFYKGIESKDIQAELDVPVTLKIGDELRVSGYAGVPAQTSDRTILDLSRSDTTETTLYTGVGIDVSTPRPIHWLKQKVDKKINNRHVTKSRESLEPLVMPRANIIKNVVPGDTTIYVDNSRLFESDVDISTDPYNLLIIDDSESLADPASNTGNYSSKVESVTSVDTVTGDSGKIIKIQSSGGTNITFTLDSFYDLENNLDVGDYFYVFGTGVGSGTTSMDGSNIIGIGTTYIDNIYKVDSRNTTDKTVTVSVNSDTVLTGVSGDVTGNSNTQATTRESIGYYSFAKIDAIQRGTSPLTITVAGNEIAGLGTFPIIERRGLGLRKTGGIDYNHVQ